MYPKIIVKEPNYGSKKYYNHIYLCNIFEIVFLFVYKKFRKKAGNPYTPQ